MSLVDRIYRRHVSSDIILSPRIDHKEVITNTPSEIEMFYYKGSGYLKHVDLECSDLYVSAPSRRYQLSNAEISLYVDGILIYRNMTKGSDSGYPTQYNKPSIDLRYEPPNATDYYFSKNSNNERVIDVIKKNSWNHCRVGYLFFDQSIRIILRVWMDAGLPHGILNGNGLAGFNKRSIRISPATSGGIYE